MCKKESRLSYTFRCFATVFALVAALLFSAVSSFAEPLRIAYTSIAMTYGPLWLTKEAGIFKKYNIEPEMLYIAGGPPSLQALIAGDVAISFTAAGAAVAANLSGSDTVLIGTTIDSLPFELYSLPTIKEPAQLRGTKMGVSRIGATTDFIARYILKKWGLQPDKDVAIFQAGAGPQIYAALKSGSVQSGVLSTGVETIRAQTDGYLRLADISTSGLTYPFGPFAARQAFLKSNSPLVARFMHAYVEGIHRFKTDKEAALAVIEKYTKTKTSPATEQIYEVYARKYVKRVPDVTREGIQTILAEIASNRPLLPGVTPERFVDSRFTKEIFDSGFADSLYRTR
ncbi:MAG TPA: ABC transporter substrate-binding protein [Methylomirabilota bacterium]|nr:ABC transporter substrate-binding protein [Methylomirabilota bacterium]